jgi:HD superfamily phosphodiesterase
MTDSRREGGFFMWRDEIEARIGALEHPAWGPAHCRRLYASMREIVRAEGLTADDDVLFALAWLHDVGTFPQYSALAETPPACAAIAADQLLAAAGFPVSKLRRVSRIIREHSFEGDARDTVEARVLRDADMLEFTGAVGLMRLLSIVRAEEWVPDPRAALKLALEFSLALPRRMFYDTSQKMAQQRRAETVTFTDALSAETAEFAAV